MYMCVCVYTHVCVCAGGCLCSMCLIACAQVLCHTSSSLILYPCTLLLEGGSAIEASVHSVSRLSPWHRGSGHVPQCLAFCTCSGSGFRSRSLCSRHFGNQTISPAPPWQSSFRSRCMLVAGKHWDRPTGRRPLVYPTQCLVHSILYTLLTVFSRNTGQILSPTVAVTQKITFFPWFRGTALCTTVCRS